MSSDEGGSEVTRVRAGDGTELHVERHGHAGPFVVFSCAFSTTHENWRPQVVPLVEAGFRPVLWDYRGHGRSAVPSFDDAEAWRFERIVEDLGTVVDWASPDEPVVLAGLSFGGLISQHRTLRSPERVRALALVGSGPGFKKAEAQAGWAAQQEKTAGFMLAKGLSEYVRRAADTCVGRNPEAKGAAAAAAAIAGQEPEALARFARDIVSSVPAVIDELGSIQQPALVAVGSEDKAFSRAAEVMAAKLPNAQKVVIEGAGHILNIEAASEFDAALLGFLRSLPGNS